MYSPERKRDYQWLVSRLKNKRMFLEKNLFVAILNVISNCDQLGFTKKKAIKVSAEQNNVTQKAIRDVLKQIEYATQKEIKRKLNTKGYYESRQLSEIMSRN